MIDEHEALSVSFSAKTKSDLMTNEEAVQAALRDLIYLKGLTVADQGLNTVPDKT